MTLARTVGIAVVLGGVWAGLSHGGLARWPVAMLLMLWPSFGGHWVELFFLNWLRPRLPAERAVHVAARVAVWFAGGCALATGMYFTAKALGTFRPERWLRWWVGGVAFIGIELGVHLLLYLGGKPSFYGERGDGAAGG